jgi:predicted DNA-binding protein (MmcQ/YjbR family)
MDIESLREFCLSIKGAEECLPFDYVTLVYKVMGKMFALLPLDSDILKISLKCDPDIALELRDRYSAVEEAHHFNKKYWNTIYPNKDMSDIEIKSWIMHSVDEVLKKLPHIKQIEYLNSISK